ncbi:MAG: CDP-alcohol phosphatidyltransferase family protein [Gammaproteobacteria bacterium]|nr:CDP-alcohol phosphatidyltransferase family protein [Gammaproteobacteria bacterium]
MSRNGAISGLHPPWDQRLARVLVRPLAKTPVTPNQLTLVSLLVSVAGALLLATGDTGLMNWGAGLFVLGRFLDHFDGELARTTGLTSRRGYYFDYLAGCASYAALFVGIAVGVSATLPGQLVLGLALLGGVSAVLVMVLDLKLDAETGDDSATGYPSWGGFELEDGIYLLAPVTWLGYLVPFFVVAAVGASLFALWTLIRVLALGRRS